MNDASPPEDAVSIALDNELWRRIPPWGMTEDDAVPAGTRPSTSNFDDPDPSVVIAVECTGGINTLLPGHDRFGVASFTVAQVRSLGFGVVRKPDDTLPGHAHVTGRKAPRSKLLTLARAGQMMRYPSA